MARNHTARLPTRSKPMNKHSRHAAIRLFAAAALAALGVLVAGGAGAAGPAQRPAEEAADDYAQRVTNAVNAYRIEKGLPALQPAPALAALAAEHSSDMAARRRPSHDNFAQRFERTGAELCVENVAQGFRVPEQVIIGWRHVATHHRNLLEPRVRYLGMANTGLYVTFFACDTPH
jgi:uncharacterized protein YkwD